MGPSNAIARWLNQYPWNAIGWLLLGQLTVCVLSYIAAVHTRFPVVNLDAVVIGLVPWIGPLIGALSIVLGLCVVVSELFGYQYLVFSVPELINNFPFFPWIVRGTVILACATAAALLTWTVWHAKTPQGHHPPIFNARSMLGLLFTAWLIEQTSGLNTLGSTFLTVRDQLRFFAQVVASNDRSHDFKPLQQSKSSQAVLAAMNRRQDIVMVVVESYGHFLDAELQTRVVQSLMPSSLKASHTLDTGLAPFQGATVHGEFRELCGAELRNLFFAKAPTGCLPAQLRAAGYQTTAFHGNDARFYRRNHWYPQVGIEHIVDLHRLPDPDKHRCGGLWNAYCDLDLMDYVGTLHDAAGPPRFDYVLTINTHLPVQPMTRGDARLTDCRPHYPDDVCTHLENTQRVFGAISRLARTQPTAMFIIAGDHSPPFFLESSKRLFDTTAVPVHILEPR
jgi:phosphoglycerol transferase MdoB-like AlkP superfamily enzyme